MTKLSRSRLQDERGSVLVLVAASLTVLIGCGAFVLDLGNSRQTARNEQNAADAGALAGAVGLPTLAAPPTYAAFKSAAHYALHTLLGRAAIEVACPASSEKPGGSETKCYEPEGGGQGTIVYVTTPWGPDTIGDGDGSIVASELNQVHVKVCSDVQTGLARIFGIGDLRPCREATAINTLSSALPFAFGAMDDDSAGAFKVSGGGSITVTGNMVVNSNADGAGLCDAGLLLEGSGGVSATVIEVRDPPGPPDGWEVCPGASGAFFPDPVNSFTEPLSDPLCPDPDDPSSCLPYPGNPGCPAPANCNSTTIWAPGDTVWPGLYDRITVNGGTLRMKPGLYVFRGSGSRFEINGGNVVVDGPVGTGVTLFFACESYPATCSAGEQGSYLSLGRDPKPCDKDIPPASPECVPPSPATAVLRAPPPGASGIGGIPAMAIFFDRNNASAPTDVNPGIGMWGESSLKVTGTIYAPAAYFRMLSGGVCAPPAPVAAGCLNSAVIVSTFEHSGSGNLTVTYAEDENVKVTGGITLIS